MCVDIKPRIKTRITKKTDFYKALLVATTVEEVASLVSIPFLIMHFFFQNNLHTNNKNKDQPTERCVHFHQRGTRTSQTFNRPYIGARKIHNRSRQCLCKKKKKNSKWCIIRIQECLRGGKKKCFCALPKFLSAHMTRHMWKHALRVYPP